MPRTQKPWAADDDKGPARTSASLVLASLLTAMTMAYVLMVFHPRLLTAVRDAWSSWGGKPAWALSTVAAGAIVASASLALLVLGTIARGVQTAPYVWSAPVLVAASTLGVSQIDVRLPVSGLSVTAFAVCSGLLMLVGGGLLQVRGWAFKVSGALLLTLPLMTIVASYAVVPGGLLGAWTNLPNSGRLFAIVLGMTWLSMGLLSMATAPAAGAAGRSRNAAQLALRWQERARAADLKVAEAERRADLAEQRLRSNTQSGRAGSQAAGPNQAAPEAFPQPGTGGSHVFVGATALVLASVLVGGYVLAYRPLAQRARTQRALLVRSAREHQVALDAAREQLESERANLNGLLTAERAKASAIVAAPARSAATRQKAAPAAGAAASEREPAESQPAAKPAAKSEARKQATDERVRAARRAPPATRGARTPAAAPGKAGDAVDDDPIGGLDDL